MDIERALSHLGSPPVGPWPAGPPAHEFDRSPAAARVGRLAGESGLFLSHYEHRARLRVPDAWVGAGREGDAEPPEWSDGVLPEPKYLSFRHDLPIGSFHPGHRAKWTTHELCHGLVGFAWSPGATPLFHATASRLAELVPVVLWYFLDEIGLRRCPRHHGPLFRTLCPACARAAAEGSVGLDPERARELLGNAHQFLDRELAAVARTVRTGVPHAHVFGSLDLCSDGIAYAAAHRARLDGVAFRLWAERFVPVERPGHARGLDGLVERIHEVFEAIVYGSPLRPVPAAAASADLAQRVLQAAADLGPELVLGVVDGLAGGPPTAALREAYAELAARHGLSPVEDVFAVGYPLEGLQTRSVAQVREGLDTVTPLCLALAQDAGFDLVPRFLAADPWVRRPLGLRFADWLAAENPGPVAALAAFEASLRAAGGEAEAVSLGPDGAGARWVEGAICLRFDADVPTFAEGVESGEVTGILREGKLGVVPEPHPGPVHVVLARDPQGELLYLDLPPDAPPGWESDPEVLGTVVPELLELGVAVPRSWSTSPGWPPPT